MNYQRVTPKPQHNLTTIHDEGLVTLGAHNMAKSIHDFKMHQNGEVYISMSDLVGMTHYNGKSLANCTIEEVLYLMGLDTTPDEEGYVTYTSEVCTHRNNNNDIVTCVLYRGKERADTRYRELKRMYTMNYDEL